MDPTGADGMDPWEDANTLGLYDWSMTWGDFGGIDFEEYNPDGSKYVAKSGMSSKPVNYVSFFDSLRFANWLNNGQGAASTEAGAYTLLGGTSLPTNWATVTRNAGARIFLTGEDEWLQGGVLRCRLHRLLRLSGEHGRRDDLRNAWCRRRTRRIAATPWATSATWGATRNRRAPTGHSTRRNVYEWNEAIILSDANTYRGVRGGSFSVLDDPFTLEVSSRASPTRPAMGNASGSGSR